MERQENDLDNATEVRMGIVAVSDGRDLALAEGRRAAVTKAVQKCGLAIEEIGATVTSESGAQEAVRQLGGLGCNALAVYLGDFGAGPPAARLADLAAKLDLPVIFTAAGEEKASGLMEKRGDAYCGLLAAGAALRGPGAFIPEYPVGTPDEVADMLREFYPVARAYIGVRGLKIFAFGPLPAAPLQPLLRMGVQVQENSGLELLENFVARKNDPRISAIAGEMAEELGADNPGLLPRLAQFEIALLDWADENKGTARHFVFANSCRAAFLRQFKLTPCYVNSRLAGRGIPVACETDLYGALSEYVLLCASGRPATLIDINNTVPHDVFLGDYGAFGGYTTTDVFIGYHCGSAPACHVKAPSIKRNMACAALSGISEMEEMGAMEGVASMQGRLAGGDVTLLRVHASPCGQLRSYIVQGEVVDVDPRTFGIAGVLAVSEMARFYRHVLLEKGFPHRAGLGYGHVGKYVHGAMRMLGGAPGAKIEIDYNLPPSRLYGTENPFHLS